MNVSPKVLLAAMPWKHANSPSIQIGTLHAVLERHGVPVESRHFFLEFLEFMIAREGVSEEDRKWLVRGYWDTCEESFMTGLGDFIFSGPPLREITPAQEHAFYESVGNHEGRIAFVKRTRAHVDAFLDYCAKEILASGAGIVGFTTTFNQNVPSLNLAARLKSANPNLIVMFGGANCEGRMGEALHRNFPFIDYVVRGEAEYVLPRLIDCLASGESVSPISGLIYRDAAGASVVNEHDRAMQVDMKDVPVPNYDSYFTLLKRAQARQLLDQNVTIMVESARGCWWGEKNHCTFCGLNGLSMAFRSKAPEVMAADVAMLSKKYQRLYFLAVDNIIDYRYFSTFLPLLADERKKGIDYHFFYETKANLKKAQVAMFSAAGVRTIQPGIESLSTPILKLMNKGTTGLQNIRLLKWAAEYGLEVSWNIICGFPGEPREEYQRMAKLLPSLAHLSRPNATNLLLERFSPYYDDPDKYGITVLGPSRYYEHVYALERDQLMELAYEFEHATQPGGVEQLVKDMQAVIDEIWPENQPGGRLSYRRGPGFVTITDSRAKMYQVLTLRGPSATIYLACDAGATVSEIRSAGERELSGVSDEQVLMLLNELVKRGMMYEERGRYLSLAVAEWPQLSYRGETAAAPEPLAASA